MPTYGECPKHDCAYDGVRISEKINRKRGRQPGVVDFHRVESTQTGEREEEAGKEETPIIIRIGRPAADAAGGLQDGER